MKNGFFIKYVLVSFIIIQSLIIKAEEHPTLAIGAKAPDFKLKNVDNKIYSLSNFAKAKVLVVLFTCNHCPTAQSYEDRIIKFVNDYKGKGVQLVAIMPNDDKAVRFDELGYTDLGDSFEDMKIRYKDKKYNFPYLYDGATEEVANLYGPVATPHVFVFDKNRILKYNGRIDDNEHIGREKTHDLRDAVDATLANTEIATAVTKTFGCSIKWASKAGTVVSEVESWAKEPVSLEKADVNKLKEIMANKGSDKYRLVNIWATWCGPCVAEFSSLVESNHMYRNRDFEFITVSADEPENFDKTLKFLKKKYSSSQNYIIDKMTKYEMIEAIDPKWQGALPYTVLIDPSGKIVFKQMGLINVRELRKNITDNIGRGFK